MNLKGGRARGGGRKKKGVGEISGKRKQNSATGNQTFSTAFSGLLGLEFNVFGVLRQKAVERFQTMMTIVDASLFAVLEQDHHRISLNLHNSRAVHSYTVVM